MAPPDPRQSIIGRLFRRKPTEPDPAPAAAPEPDKPKKRKPRHQYVPPSWDGPGPIPAVFHTGQPTQSRSRQRKAPWAEFGDRSESDRIKKEQAFQRRFKSDRAQATALDAMADAEAVRQALKDQHIERLRGLTDDLHRLTASGRPVPPEAGQHINQRFADAFAQHDRDMAVVGRQLDRSLEMAETWDLRNAKITINPDSDRRKRKRLTYSPDRPRDFMDAVTQPLSPGPAPAPPRAVLDHPFNDAATQPEAPKRSSEPAFTEAVTAPRTIDVWLTTFERAVPPRPDSPGPSPGR